MKALDAVEACLAAIEARDDELHAWTVNYAQYAKALAYTASCRRRLRDAFSDIDAILTPSATGEAPLGLDSTGNTAMNRLWTLLHGPCVTVPAGVGPAGMPLGVIRSSEPLFEAP